MIVSIPDLCILTYFNPFYTGNLYMDAYRNLHPERIRADDKKQTFKQDLCPVGTRDGKKKYRTKLVDLFD